MGLLSSVLAGVNGVLSVLNSGFDLLKKWEERRDRRREKKEAGLKVAEEKLKNYRLTIQQSYSDRYRAFGTRFKNGDGRSKAQLHLGMLDSAEIMIRDFPSEFFRNDRETQMDPKLLHAVSIRTRLLSP